ncbi:MAG: DUF58 domain-containing protein, partial [Dehalococcoidia bacterium]
MRQLALGIPILVLLGLALITGFRPLYFLLYFVALVSILAYLWAWLQTRGLEVWVESLSLRPQVGHPLQLKITVREKLGLPRIALRFKLSDRLAERDEQVLNLQPRASTEWTTLVRDHHRGINVIGSLTITASDPLGLVRLSRQVGDPHTIMVYPNVVPLSSGLSIGAASLGDIGDASLMISASTLASRVREYRPGDSLSHIHWPSTAKTDRLMSKEFDSGGHSEVWIFLDLQASTHAGAGLESTEEYGVTIAASLAKSLIEAGQQVGLVTQGDNLHNIPPKREMDHLWDILKALALVKAEGNIALPTLMVKESIGLAPGSVAVVVAPGPTQSQTT